MCSIRILHAYPATSKAAVKAMVSMNHALVLHVIAKLIRPSRVNIMRAKMAGACFGI